LLNTILLILHTNLVNILSKINVITNSTFIINKQGIDYINFNKQISKHKVSKLSLITDIKGLPLNIYLA
jgi:hypothetical protein